ncbi:ParA family protein [Exiguobacterium antarcticum]|uniref:ParA family protein n=1 Tax=Exiguobacterium antarcticum TaxID=132920 RepID=A0ABT6R4T2_9BACL|nr:ParA family protein [Exiguobacterium antarcticum]MDI3235952.1 ParA family protein [Exiguobacterium antarcticum]
MPGEVIAIISNKGGVLKTSMTTNLAGQLSLIDKKILIVDMDIQSDVAVTFGQNPDLLEEDVEYSLYDALIKGVDPQKALVSVDKNIDLLVTNDDMLFFEFDVLLDARQFPTQKRFSLLKEVIEKIKMNYDYVLIDTPTSFGLIQGNILMACQDMIIPFQPEKYAMRSLQKTLKIVNDFKIQMNPELRVRAIVPTLVNQRTLLHRGIMDLLQDYAMNSKIKVTKTFIPTTIEFASSVGFEQKPLSLAAPNSKGAKIYNDLLKELKLV